ncbi:MAG: C4-dicarboxylate ABC transporter [Firmicutes bacterium]|nr:C4-dicarboxylate ABC transporter [Bacillota bacterium]
MVKHITPKWFTITMGTGIVALDAYLLPGSTGWLKNFGTLFWLVNMMLLTLFMVGLATRFVKDWPSMRTIFAHPVESLFFGAVPMALTTVVNGFFDIGPHVLGHPAIAIGGILWLFNAALALASVIVIPFFMFTRHEHGLGQMTAIWLMPIVPAEVAAASGGLWLPHLASLAERQDLYVVVAALWALSVPLAFLILGVLFVRLAVHKLPVQELAISTWITLGTLGTGIMGLMLLAHASPLAFPALAYGLRAATTLSALILWGFGLWWLVMSGLITLYYTRQRKLPFNLGWWGLTFPLGVFVGGSDLLNRALGTPIFHWSTVMLFVLLGLFWLTVASRSIWHIVAPRHRTSNQLPVTEVVEEAI